MAMRAQLRLQKDNKSQVFLEVAMCSRWFGTHRLGSVQPAKNIDSGLEQDAAGDEKKKKKKINNSVEKETTQYLCFSLFKIGLPDATYPRLPSSLRVRFDFSFPATRSKLPWTQTRPVVRPSEGHA